MATNNNGLKVPNITNQYPQSASVISKLIKSDTAIKYNPADISFKDINMSIKEKIASNDDILDLFPDVELAIQILTSSILAPNDMINIALQYEPPAISLPSDIKQTILDTIRQYMDSNYNITSKLPIILRESMFTKGAYIEAIIPEASVDDVINQTNYSRVSVESFANDSIGYLGTGKNTRFFITKEDRSFNVNGVVNQPLFKNNTKQPEITQEDLNIQITDNPKVLLYSRNVLKQIEKASKVKSSKAINLSTEAEDDTLEKVFKSESKLVYRDFINVPTADAASRESIGSPLVIKLPVEAVVPVHATSDTSKHLGYFVILDENGNPLNIKDGLINYNEAMSNMTFLNNASASGLITKAKLALQGAVKVTPTLKELEPLYNDIVEAMIKDRLKNGMFRELADLNESADIYKVMLVRSLKAQQTKVLFLPKDLVAYYAFEYRDNGTGKSLLEKNLLLFSMRSILLFARLMASIKNSINTTVVSATLDEHDPDPESSREKIISESLKTRQATIPLGLIRPDDLTEWTHRVGFMYKIQHPALPNIELDVTDTAPNKIVPDEELDNKLAERILMSFGLTPEIVMAGYSSDFATTVASRNLLFAKRCTATQMLFMPQVTEHVRMILRNDFVLVEKLKQIFKSNIKQIRAVTSKSEAEEEDVNLKKISDNNLIDWLTKQYIDKIELSLPNIVLTEATASKNAFEEFKTNLDALFDDVFTSTVFNEKFAGKLSNEIEGYKDVWKAMGRLKWATENNFLPEITSMFSRDDEGKPEFDIFGQYLSYKDSIVELAEKFSKLAKKSKDKSDKLMDKIEENVGGSEGGGDDYGSSDDSGGDEGGDSGAEGGSEGGDDFGAEGGEGGDDAGGDFGDSGGGDMDDGGDTDFDSGGNDLGDMDTGGDDTGASESESGQDSGTQKQSEEPEEGEGNEPEEPVEDENDTGDKNDESNEDKNDEDENDNNVEEGNNEEEQDKQKEEEEKQKQEEEDKKKKEEEEKKKKDKDADEAYNLDLYRTKNGM